MLPLTLRAYIFTELLLIGVLQLNYLPSISGRLGNDPRFPINKQSRPFLRVIVFSGKLINHKEQVVTTCLPLAFITERLENACHTHQKIIYCVTRLSVTIKTINRSGIVPDPQLLLLRTSLRTILV